MYYIDLYEIFLINKTYVLFHHHLYLKYYELYIMDLYVKLFDYKLRILIKNYVYAKFISNYIMTKNYVL